MIAWLRRLFRREVRVSPAEGARVRGSITVVGEGSVHLRNVDVEGDIVVVAKPRSK